MLLMMIMIMIWVNMETAVAYEVYRRRRRVAATKRGRRKSAGGSAQAHRNKSAHGCRRLISSASISRISGSGMWLYMPVERRRRCCWLLQRRYGLRI